MTLDIIIKIVIIGLGGAYAIDIWAYILLKQFKVKSLDYRLLGRWVGYMPKAKYFHNTIIESPPVSHELLLGWLTHSLIGVTFAFFLVGLFGLEWINNPTFIPAIVVGLLTLFGPFLILQPALGFGIAGSKTPNPTFGRLKSVITHLVFGTGLYVSAFIISVIIK